MTLEDAALLDYPQAFWTREYLWPRGDRRRIFLANAVNDVGSAMFGPDWTGQEPAEGIEFDVDDLPDALGDLPMAEALERRRVHRPQVGSSGKVILHLDAEGYYHHTQDWHVVAFKQEQHRQKRICHARAAHDAYMRLTQVCEWIADVGVNEDVATFGRVADGTEKFLLPGHVWNVEPVWDKMVAACSFDYPSIHRGKLARHPTYLFLDRESLARCLCSLEFGPKAPPAAPSAANAEGVSDVKAAPAAAPVKRGRGRRAGVGGFKALDDALVDEIVVLVREQRISPWAAAKTFIDRIAGYTNDEEAKLKRVVARYYKHFDENGDPIALT